MKKRTGIYNLIGTIAIILAIAAAAGIFFRLTKLPPQPETPKIQEIKLSVEEIIF